MVEEKEKKILDFFNEFTSQNNNQLIVRNWVLTQSRHDVEIPDILLPQIASIVTLNLDKKKEEALNNRLINLREIINNNSYWTSATLKQIPGKIKDARKEMKNFGDDQAILSADFESKKTLWKALYDGLTKKHKKLGVFSESNSRWDPFLKALQDGNHEIQNIYKANNYSDQWENSKLQDFKESMTAVRNIKGVDYILEIIDTRK